MNPDAIQILHTPEGERFGLVGEKGAHPAPTLFIFASRLEDSLGTDPYNRAGRSLAREGILCVSLDVPGHGQDARAGEPEGMRSWRARLEQGEDPVAGFTAKVSAVLDQLIQEGYTDPRKVAICGTSRGGFMAMHVAAADARVRCVAAFAPVTELLALREFEGCEDHPTVCSLALIRSAERLAGRALWICIGNNDERVGTDHAIALARGVVTASVAQDRPANVELHVMPSPGHRTHATAYEEAAAWIRAQMSDRE